MQALKKNGQLKYGAWLYGVYYKNVRQAIFDLLYTDGGCDTIQDAIRIIQYAFKVFKVQNKDKEKILQQYLSIK